MEYFLPRWQRGRRDPALNYHGEKLSRWHKLPSRSRLKETWHKTITQESALKHLWHSTAWNHSTTSDLHRFNVNSWRDNYVRRDDSVAVVIQDPLNYQGTSVAVTWAAVAIQAVQNGQENNCRDDLEGCHGPGCTPYFWVTIECHGDLHSRHGPGCSRSLLRRDAAMTTWPSRSRKRLALPLKCAAMTRMAAADQERLHRTWAWRTWSCLHWTCAPILRLEMQLAVTHLE